MALPSRFAKQGDGVAAVRLQGWGERLPRQLPALSPDVSLYVCGNGVRRFLYVTYSLVVSSYHLHVEAIS